MGVTPEELIGRARELAPGIASRARESEALRAPHDDTIADLIDADLMPVLVPKRFGGHEMDLGTHVEIVEAISAACLSTGWVTAFYLGHNWIVTKFSETAQAEVFRDRPFALVPVATAPTMSVEREGEGFRVRGRAPWGTGIMHADWVMVGGLVEDEGPFMFLLPRDDVEIADTWQMAGMAGTGSNDVVVDGAFVPAHRAISTIRVAEGATEGSRIHANPLYQLPLLPFLYCEAMPVFSGGLRGAVAAFEATLRDRVTSFGQARVAEGQHMHVEVGAARARADVAETVVREIVRRTLAFHAAGSWEMPARLELKGLAGFLVDHCRGAANELVQHAGARSFHRDAPLQRFFRDLNVLATHAFWDWDMSREQVGRGALGLEPTSPML